MMESVILHANSVLKSEIFQITRRRDEDRYLHLLAFIAHQYYRLQDNLVDVLLNSIRAIKTALSVSIKKNVMHNG
ncbi:MAG: hypothetical protein IPO71_05370 [Nitrosomonas sp.]|nr:hypothetical protein [Nitrosomonas sp.]